MPELAHHYVPLTAPDPVFVQRILDEAAHTTCDRFADHDISPLSGLDNAAIARLAADLDQGTLRLPARPPVAFTPQFAPADLSQPESAIGLLLASLAVPDLMVRLWRLTQDPRWLYRARDYLHGWARFERSSLIPTGFQWNDHAVAARVFVLTRYLCAAWKLRILTSRETATLLGLIFASGERISKPDYWTYRTNHGLMQSLALLHIAATFPREPRSAQFAELGTSRIRQQLETYLSPEGVVLEHSAGYHGWGVELLGMALVYFDALGESWPRRLFDRYQRAVQFFGQLRRPDGTLVPWGDTYRGNVAPRILSATLDGKPRLVRAPRWPEPSVTTWAPQSGVAVWWSRPGEAHTAIPTQTLLTWANFATQAHKHADEMSFLVWVEPFEVLTATGYWPYDHPRRTDALNWTGSNAPHLVGERWDGTRTSITVLRGMATSPSVEVADLERTRPDGVKIRRQLVYFRPNRWVVLDTAEAPPAATIETAWTFDPHLTATISSDLVVLRLTAGTAPVARIRLSGCQGGKAQLLRGSHTPFVGWTAAYGYIQESYALLRRCPAQTPALFVLTAPPHPPEPAELDLRFDAPDRWKLISGGHILLDRNGDTVYPHPGLCGADCRPLRLLADSSSDRARESVQHAYRRLAEIHSRFNDSWLPYRVKATKAIAAALLGQLAVLSLPPARRLLAARPLVLTLPILFWLFLAGWLHFQYFR